MPKHDEECKCGICKFECAVKKLDPQLKVIK